MREVLKPEGTYYELLELVGEGLCSCVYKALRSDSRKHSSQVIALKRLKSETHMQLLRNEFSALSQIRSAHCVSVLGWENFAESSALVLEFVEGISLSQLLKLGRINLQLLDEITRQVQIGLSDLRRQSFCHGDLTPSNILIDIRGTVKLVDFGLANWSEKENFGTPDYLSPERWRGEGPNYYSDLYALGLIRLRIDEEAPLGPLMKTEPACRLPLSLHQDDQAQAELAQMVQAILKERIQRPVVTELLRTVSVSESIPALREQVMERLFVAFLFLLICFSPVGPRALLPTLKPASLVIRSQAWLHVRLDQRDLGYAPVQVESLYPGRYRLYWKTARSQGVSDLTLATGERKMLTEADFAAQSR